MDVGAPLGPINAALFARQVSFLKKSGAGKQGSGGAGPRVSVGTRGGWSRQCATPCT